MPHDRSTCVIFRGPTSGALKFYCKEIWVKKLHWNSAGGSFIVKNVEEASVDEDGHGDDDSDCDSDDLDDKKQQQEEEEDEEMDCGNKPHQPFDAAPTAADQYQLDNQYKLGLMYMNDASLAARDKENTAASWFTKAAAGGHTEAAYRLAVCYRKGLGVEKSLPEAFHWYRRAADKQHCKSLYVVGALYENGAGGERSFKDAVDCYEKAAAQGHAKAQFRLGVRYAQGTLGLEKSYEIALKFYKMAARQGHGQAQSNLAGLFFNGFGVEKDLDLAIKLHRKAASKVSEVIESEAFVFQIKICLVLLSKSVASDLLVLYVDVTDS